MIYKSFLKRFIDLSASFFGLLIFSPIISAFAIVIFIYDKSSPFYIASRIGKNDKPFKIIKLR
tara:strand:- start:18 stop:206 length:189 start_codon:yes stop_codon:yes gene_type:complete